MGFGTGIEYFKEMWTTDKGMKVTIDEEFLNIEIKMDDDIKLIIHDKKIIFNIKLKLNKVRQLWGILDIMKNPEKKRM